MLSDVSTNTLWACEIGPRSAPGVPGPRTLLSFALTRGAPKARWKLPGASSVCNDFTIGPDHALYVSDTPNSTIFRVRPGTTEGEVFITNRTLDGVDGLTFLDGVLYANNVSASTIWRIPMDANGKAGNPVNIWTDQPIKGPDGMRAAGRHLFLAENANGRASMLTITGDTAHVTVIQTGLKRPTAIEPAGDVLWVGDISNDNVAILDPAAALGVGRTKECSMNTSLLFSAPDVAPHPGRLTVMPVKDVQTGCSHVFKCVGA